MLKKQHIFHCVYLLLGPGSKSPKMKSSTSIRARLLSFFHNNLLYARRLADITARKIFPSM